MDPRTLRTRMVGAFSLDDLEAICQDVEQELKLRGKNEKISLDIVGRGGLMITVLNLITFLDRRGYLDYLVMVVRQHRPGLV